MFPQHIRTSVEHRFDRTHKRVAAIRLIRFADLIIHHEHQRELAPAASGVFSSPKPGSRDCLSCPCSITN